MAADLHGNKTCLFGLLFYYKVTHLAFSFWRSWNESLCRSLSVLNGKGKCCFNSVGKNGIFQHGSVSKVYLVIKAELEMMYL